MKDRLGDCWRELREYIFARQRFCGRRFLLAGIVIYSKSLKQRAHAVAGPDVLPL